MKIPRKNWLEWTVFALGFVLLLAVVGFLVVETFVVAGDTATLSVALDAPRAPEDAAPRHILVPVTVHNSGAHAAEAVVVEVEGAFAGETVRGQVEFADVPRMSSRTGMVAFPLAAARAEMQARIVSYTEP